MGLFDFLKKKKPQVTQPAADNKEVIPPQVIVEMARVHPPESIYIDADGEHLNGMVSEAVDKIMHYDGIMPVSSALMLMNDPQEMKQKIRNADVDTLLIFFKFLAVKASETKDNKPIGYIQSFLISVLQEKLSNN